MNFRYLEVGAASPELSAEIEHAVLHPDARAVGILMPWRATIRAGLRRYNEADCIRGHPELMTLTAS